MSVAANTTSIGIHINFVAGRCKEQALRALVLFCFSLLVGETFWVSSSLSGSLKHFLTTQAMSEAIMELRNAEAEAVEHLADHAETEVVVHLAAVDQAEVEVAENLAAVDHEVVEEIVEPLAAVDHEVNE